MSNARPLASQPPPWWRWYEPPRWFPNWLHMRTCTFCRGLSRYGRQQLREAPRG